MHAGTASCCLVQALQPHGYDLQYNKLAGYHFNNDNYSVLRHGVTLIW